MPHPERLAKARRLDGMDVLVFLLIVLLAVWLGTQLINMLFQDNPQGQRIGVIILLVIALLAVLQHFAVIRF